MGKPSYAEIIEQCKMPYNKANMVPTVVTNIYINIKCSTPDPNDPSKRHGDLLPDCEMNDSSKITEIVNRYFKVKDKEKERNKDQIFYVKYNNRLFSTQAADGSSETIPTIRECGIRNKTTVELVCFQAESQALINQGFQISYWAMIPAMIAISFIVAGLVGRFNLITRGLYLLFGSLILVPSLLCFIVGTIELYSGPAVTSFSGDYWFGRCCCTNGCCDNTCCSCCVCDDVKENATPERA